MQRHMIWMLVLILMMLTLAACGGEPTSAEQELQEQEMQSQTQIQESQEQEIQEQIHDSQALENGPYERVPEYASYRRISITDDPVIIEVEGVEKDIPVSRIVEFVRDKGFWEQNVESEFDFVEGIALWERLGEAHSFRGLSAPIEKNELYLNRFNRFYSLGSRFTSEEYKDARTYTSAVEGLVNDGGGVPSQFYSWLKGDNKQMYVLSYGDIAEYLIIHDSVEDYGEQKIVMTADSNPGDLILDPVNDVGYTIGAFSHIETWVYGKSTSSSSLSVIDLINNTRYSYDYPGVDIFDFEIICDDTGERIDPINGDNVRDLGYGTMYTLSWFEGTEYHEVKAPATCRVYKVDEAGRIIIPKSMNKDKGWAEYDLSQVPAGKYVVEGTTEYWHGVGAIIDVR